MHSVPYWVCVAEGPVCLLRFPSLPGSEPSPLCLCHSCWPHSSGIAYVHSDYKLQQNDIITVLSMQQQFNDYNFRVLMIITMTMMIQSNSIQFSFTTVPGEQHNGQLRDVHKIQTQITEIKNATQQSTKSEI